MRSSTPDGRPARRVHEFRFPALERTLRETEFAVSQDETGHQTSRSALRIQLVVHDFHAAADGQLGGIVKVCRAFLSTATGYGTVGIRGGKPFVEVRHGKIEVREIRTSA